jgi:hypothetical protein
MHRDPRCRLDGLPASRLRIGREAEQRQLSIADKLVRLAAAFHHGLRYGGQEAVDDENGIERQKLFGQFCRSAHIHEHADNVALASSMGWLDRRGRRRGCVGGEYLEEGDIGSGPQLAGEADRGVVARADALQHEGSRFDGVGNWL